MKLTIADHHCHISKEYFDDPVSEIKSLHADSGLEYVVIMGVDYNNDVENLSYKLQYADPFLKIGVGLHPAEIIELGDFAIQEYERIERLIRENSNQIDYIGEIGIDFTYPHAEEAREMQIKIFRKFCELSVELNLPVSIHARGAMSEVLDVVRSTFSKERFNGYLHCFTGTYEDAVDCVEHGLKLGIGGIITFKKSEELRSDLKKLFAAYPEKDPNELIGLETDTPYLTPEPKRSEKNSPRNIQLIADFLQHSFQ
jgi:TatD DNase family protein